MLRPPRRLVVTIVVTASVLSACEPGSGTQMDATRQKAIGDTLTALIRSAYDLRAKDVVGRLMSLYPDSGRVISASGGRVTTTRDSLEPGSSRSNASPSTDTPRPPGSGRRTASE